MPSFYCHGYNIVYVFSGEVSFKENMNVITHTHAQHRVSTIGKYTYMFVN